MKTPFRALGGSRLGVFRWTAGIVKLLLPPRQSRGISYFCLGIARAIQQQSGEVLLVDHGSLYPALQRIESQGWISAKWGISDNNRKARFYELTAAGRRQLTHETGQWRKLVAAIGRVLGPEEAEG